MSPTESVLAAVAAARPRLGHTTLVCVDGRAGAGKTDLVDSVVARLETPAQVLHTDEVCHGWDDLPNLADRLGTGLAPLRTGTSGRIRTWDWSADAPGPWRTLEPGRLLIVEGAGAYARSLSDAVSLLVWVQCAADLRKRRALLRDGPVFAPHWDAWAAQEELVHEREATRAAAALEIRTDREAA